MKNDSRKQVERARVDRSMTRIQNPRRQPNTEHDDRPEKQVGNFTEPNPTPRPGETNPETAHSGKGTERTPAAPPKKE